MVFKIAYFPELRIDYQSAKLQYCRLSVASFIDGLRKYNDDVIMEFENLSFVKLNIGYQPS